MDNINQPACDALNEQALQHFASQEIEQAVALWRRGLQLSPNDLQTHIYLGAALRSLGENVAAVEHYERALQLQPAMPLVHYNLGNIRQDLGALELAAECYRTALTLQPDFALAAYNLANIHRDQGRLREAIQYYRQAITSDPGHAPSYNNLGNALKYQGDLAQAITCYEKALHYHSDYADAQYNLGNAFYEMQDFANAMTWFDRAAMRDAAARALYCSYKTRQFDDFRARLLVLQRQTDHHSPQVATLVAHHAVNFHVDNNYGFCPRPFDFVYHESMPELAAPDSPLREALLDDIKHAAIDERKQGRLHHGVQSSGNLFYRSEASFRTLADLVRDHFGRYLDRFKDANCDLIKAFPQAREFESSWYIRMHQGGHLTSHIHESGWISGALYLALPGRPEGSQEGCFELGVDGDDYPVVAGAGEFRSQVLPLGVGDIVLFPANLFHRTVPFQARQERICIAFDLKPGNPRV
ncbi:MAG: tetratricopeptide repeat protein [Halioglobus sp.]